MNFWDRLGFLLGRKDSQARIISSINQMGSPVGTPANYEGFTRQGFAKNALVFKAVSMIAQSAAGINWILYSKRKGGDKTEVEESPLLELLKRPNPMQGTSAFIEAVVAFYKITGNSYIEAVRPNPTTPPLELWPVRPDRMKIIPGKNGYPRAYQFEVNGQRKIWEVDFVKLKSDILHVKTFNPLNDWYGMSPLEAALLALDQNNAASKWNLSLLQNSATPSGVLQMRVSDANPRGELTKEQYVRLREEFYESHVGARNAGKPLIVEGGLEWKQISLSPKDMEFLKGKEVSSMDIALVYGVPPELLGLGQKTFNNYREARLAFYEETVLPTMDFIRDELNRWLIPAFGDDLLLDYDRDDIEALTYKREQKFTTVKDANFLTQNEKREAVGYEAMEGWDVFVIGNQIVTDPTQVTQPNEEEPEDDEQDEDGEQGNDNALNGNENPNGNGTRKPNGEDDEPDDDDTKGWKSINLVNSNEKRQSWRRQNARRKRLQSNFERDLAQDLKEMNEAIAKAATTPGDSRLKEFAMLKAANEEMPKIKNTLKRHIRYTLTDFGNMVLEEGKSIFQITETKANLKYDSFVNAYIEQRTGRAITEIEGTTKKQVQRITQRLVFEAIDEGNTNVELANDLQKEMDALTPGRARTIARTEVNMASTNGALEAVKSLQVPGMVKEWVTANDDRVRDGGDGNDADHSVMNGAEMPLDEKFGVPPDALMDGPGDPSAGADQVINCRCVLTFKSKNRGQL